MLSKELARSIEAPESEESGPSRNIITGRRNRPVGLYCSTKNGAGCPWESGNELHALYLAEVSPDVVRYKTQPETLSIAINGTKKRYTPDLKEVMADGRVVISEIKEDADDLDPCYRQKLDYVRTYYRERGIEFRIIDRAYIEAQPRFESAEAIQLFGRTVVTAADVMLAREMLAGNTEVALWELRDRYKTIPLGFAKICGMVVRRIISIDLSVKLGPYTPVRLVERH